jgi:acetyltransferase
VLENVITDPAADGFLIILTPQAMIDAEGTAGVIARSAEKSHKPFITSFMGEERVRQSIEILKSSLIPNFSYPEPAVRAFRKLYDYGLWTKKEEVPLPEMPADRETVANLLREARQKGQFQFAEDVSREILAAYGFRFPAKELVLTPRDASNAASKIGFPVVMKISSPDILHKTDIGGVKIGINSKKEAVEAFTDITLNARKFMPSAFINGVAVYEMVPKGKEVIVGLTFDRTFGHMIMFGLGGIYVEVLKDVSFRIVPVNPLDAVEMIHELKTFPLLKGTRGERPVDIDSIIDCIVRISRLASDFPVIQELDINPLVVNEKGAVALDARIIISHSEGGV